LLEEIAIIFDKEAVAMPIAAEVYEEKKVQLSVYTKQVEV
jgi:hypothetical protein